MTDFASNGAANKRKRDGKLEHESPTENLVGGPGVKAASLAVNDLLNSNSTNSGGGGSQMSFGLDESYSTVFLEQVSFDEPFAPFPSLEPKHKRNAAKRRKRDPTPPMHHLSTSSAMLSIALKNAPKTQKASLGRPRKPVPEDQAPKRPVGRPRLHPAKDAADPNKPKRVSKGDKPLGRPRTSHLKPKPDVRPRGRPRKEGAGGEGEASDNGSVEGSSEDGSHGSQSEDDDAEAADLDDRDLDVADALPVSALPAASAAALEHPSAINPPTGDSSATRRGRSSSARTSTSASAQP